MSVATTLTALLLPALGALRENVNRVICSSNLRQISFATAMWADDHRDQLPPTSKLNADPAMPIEPQELMASYHGISVANQDPIEDGNGQFGWGNAQHNSYTNPTLDPGFPMDNFPPDGDEPTDSPDEHPAGWDGLGLLYTWEYCRAIGCFYCPSHKGEHPMERYADQWDRPGDSTIYINYHYAGHIEWDSRRKRAFKFSNQFLIASDGLRTMSDFNHGSGMNLAFGDGSVEWRGSALAIYEQLPENQLPIDMQENVYGPIWNELDSHNLDNLFQNQGPLGPGN